ncbi:MAG: CheR family methyltransferase [Candidatus Promineifilaceae bacterium]
MLPASRFKKPEMSSAEQELWRNLIRERCGIFFTTGRLYFMEQRIWERMKVYDLKSYRDFYNFIAFNPKGKLEWPHLRDQLLNNETSFFRHRPSYDALIEQAVPQLVARKRQVQDLTLNFWSAGCSGGQEAYSIAMTLLERIDPAQWQIRISGTDISQTQLRKARDGIYKGYNVRYMPDYYRKKYLEQTSGKHGSTFRVRPDVQRLVQFGFLNLHKPSNYWVAGQDIIFCHNVLIYFTLDDRIAIVQRLAQKLNVGGYLFLGPAEVVGLRLPNMKLINWQDVLVYQKTG